GVIPQFLLIWFWARWSARRARLALTWGDKGWGVLLILFGLFSHIGLDSLNSYGVHPFWPVDNHWYYGDSVFIAEPWFWLTLSPVLYCAATGKLAKLFFGSVFLGGASLTLLSGFVPWYSSLPLALFGVVLWKGTRRFSPGVRLAIAVLSTTVAVTGF